MRFCSTVDEPGAAGQWRLLIARTAAWSLGSQANPVERQVRAFFMWKGDILYSLYFVAIPPKLMLEYTSPRFAA